MPPWPFASAFLVLIRQRARPRPPAGRGTVYLRARGMRERVVVVRNARISFGWKTDIQEPRSFALEQEVPRPERRRPLQGEGDDEVGEAVAVDVALDDPLGPGLEGAKLAGRLAERVGADPGEGLVAADRAAGVDRAQVDLVRARREVDYVVPGHRIGFGHRLIAEQVRAAAAREIGRASCRERG